MLGKKCLISQNVPIDILGVDIWDNLVQITYTSQIDKYIVRTDK